MADRAKITQHPARLSRIYYTRMNTAMEDNPPSATSSVSDLELVKRARSPPSHSLAQMYEKDNPTVLYQIVTNKHSKRRNKPPAQRMQRKWTRVHDLRQRARLVIDKSRAEAE